MPITAGVIDLFSVPPVHLLAKSVASPTALANPFSGSGSLTVTSGGVSAFGLHWAVNTAPPEAGRSARALLLYELPYLAFAVHYVLSDASDFIGDNLLTGAAEGFHLFTLALPATIHYDILAGWTVHFDWIIQP